MTTIASAGTGSWNTPATWSPAQVPVAGDIVNIGVGHVITYDKDGTGIALGKVTVDGTLSFATDMSTVMLFDDATVEVLTISATGTLQIGTEGSPLPDTYTAQIQFDQGSIVRHVLNLANGATVDIWGSASYFGNLRNTTLQDSWSSGTSFFVNGDASGWKVGQKLYVNSNSATVATTTSYQTDADFYEITVVGVYDSGNDRTEITCAKDGLGAGITDPVVASNIGGKVINCSRNITLGYPGNANLWDVYNNYNGNVEKIRGNSAQGSPYIRQKFNNCLFHSWYIAMNLGEGVIYTGSCFVSNHICFSAVNNYIVDADFVSNYYGVYNSDYCQVGIPVDSNFYSNHYPVYSCDLCTINGDIGSILVGVYGSTRVTINGDISSGRYGVQTGTDNSINGNISRCGTAILNPSILKMTGTLLANTTDITIDSSEVIGSAILTNSVVGGIEAPLRIYQNVGTILPVVSGDAQWTSSGGPPSLADWMLSANPNSSMYTASVFMGLTLSPHASMTAFAAAGSRTLTFKVYPYGTWASALDNTDVVLRVKYRSGYSTVAEAVNTTATYSNNGWRDVTVSFTQSVAGAISFTLELHAYESGKSLLIDPIWEIT